MKAFIKPVTPQFAALVGMALLLVAFAPAAVSDAQAVGAATPPVRISINLPGAEFGFPHLQPVAAHGQAASAEKQGTSSFDTVSGKTVHLLTIGNSFSGNATAYLSQIAKADGNTLILQTGSIGGGSLQQHWGKVEAHEKNAASLNGRYATGKSLEELLTAQPWDYITVQQASPISHDPASYHPYVEKLLAYVRKYAPHATVLVHETWPYRVDDPRFTRPETALKGEPTTQKMMYDKVRAAYDMIAKDLGGLRIIPVGDAFDKANNDPVWGYRPDTTFDPKTAVEPHLPNQVHSLNGGWYWDTTTDKTKHTLKLDSHHAGVAGQYLAGCVWYETLFGKSPIGNSFVPRGLGPTYARFLQETAHSAVQERLAPQN